MDDDLMVELGQLWEVELRPVYWLMDDTPSDDDTLVFTNLNLLKAEKFIDEPDVLDHENKVETICVSSEVDDRITPDILQKIILEEDQADWPDEQIIYLVSKDEERMGNS